MILLHYHPSLPLLQGIPNHPDVVVEEKSSAMSLPSTVFPSHADLYMLVRVALRYPEKSLIGMICSEHGVVTYEVSDVGLMYYRDMGPHLIRGDLEQRIISAKASVFEQCQQQSFMEEFSQYVQELGGGLFHFSIRNYEDLPSRDGRIESF